MLRAAVWILATCFDTLVRNILWYFGAHWMCAPNLFFSCRDVASFVETITLYIILLLYYIVLICTYNKMNIFTILHRYLIYISCAPPYTWTSRTETDFEIYWKSAADQYVNMKWLIVILVSISNPWNIHTKYFSRAALL